uniref:Synaptobrevin, longin-like domain protein n=1 Tax=Tanacetum cinerariifolium TaxID=118510 RepID=A0A6L2NNA7_TANCI|nr:hypothetical protein [Tanacetum cinerariifolium]
MIAYLTKSDASEGFNQVIDFLNGSYIKLQALVDKKKVVITEAAIREVLRLDDAEGVDCLPNEEIFAELARMGYEKPSTKLTFYKAFFSSQWKFLIHTILQSMSAKRISWNEFSSAMASTVICLSTVAQALEISKLKKRVKKLDKGNMVKVLKLRRLEKVGTSQRIDTSEDTVMKDASNQGRMIDDLDKDDERQAESQDEIYKIDMDHASKVLSMQEDEPAEVQEVVDVVTTAKLIIEVVTAVSEIVTAASTIISTAEPKVPAATITVTPVRVAAASTRRRKGVVIRDPEEESTTSSIIPADTKSKDKGKGIMVEDLKSLKKKQQVEMDEEYARKLHAKLNKDIDWDTAIDHVKQKDKEDPAVQRYQVIKKRPQTEAQARKNMIMYLKNTKEQIEEEENRAIQSINETPAQKEANRRKLNEEVEDLKRHLEIVPDEDDAVYTEATPFARKVPVVDYEIIHLNNKPHYKIIRADGTHQLYVSFMTLLKNFDREDLESLWSLVKERFSTSKPNNFFDDFLLTTLGAMFERPDGQAQVWKNQRTVHGQSKVKSWKLLESCGVHIITFTATQLILLVERRYPLSRFTVDQMLNAVRLRVEEQSEMSLELLRFTRQQHQEGQLE